MHWIALPLPSWEGEPPADLGALGWWALRFTPRVALVDGDDATLKRFYREKNRIRLEPANSRMKPIYSSNVEVLGVLVGVIREC